MDKFIDKLALDLICLHFDFAKSTSSVLIAHIHKGSVKNKLAEVGRCLRRENFTKIHFGKIHFRKIHFGCQSLNAIGPSMSLVGTKCPRRPSYVRAIIE